MASIGRWLSQALAGAALALAVGAVLCGTAGEARAARGDPCNCTTDSCAYKTDGTCCTGFCNCPNNCGCGIYTDPDTGNKYPRCLIS